mgnify:CR=1 FL=1
MKEMYQKSIQMIKDLQRIPSEREWNSIAKEKCLMSYTTLEYWGNKGFHRLCKKVRRAS